MSELKPDPATIARPDCRTCNGHGFVHCIPREGGEPYPVLCGNCLEASQPATPTPLSMDEQIEAARAFCARAAEGDSDNPLRVAEANAYYQGRRDDSVAFRATLAALSSRALTDQTRGTVTVGEIKTVLREKLDLSAELLAEMEDNLTEVAVAVLLAAISTVEAVARPKGIVTSDTPAEGELNTSPSAMERLELLRLDAMVMEDNFLVEAAAARDALEPFAQEAEGYDRTGPDAWGDEDMAAEDTHERLKVGDFRRAAKAFAALSKAPNDQVDEHQARHLFASAIYDSENTGRLQEHPDEWPEYLRRADSLLHHMGVLGLALSNQVAIPDGEAVARLGASHNSFIEMIGPTKDADGLYRWIKRPTHEQVQEALAAANAARAAILAMPQGERDR